MHFVEIAGRGRVGSLYRDYDAPFKEM